MEPKPIESGGSAEAGASESTRAASTRLYIDSVVKILVTFQLSDYDAPWQACYPAACTGSGVHLGGGRVLTSAHVVADATILFVQRAAAPDKLLARVLAISHEVDLALLLVPVGLEDMAAAELASALPSLRSKVSLSGFPIGGDEISITDGVVSRVELQTYTHSGVESVSITVDAALNPGNSGGPAFLGTAVVGIAMQIIEDAQSIGMLVPCTVAQLFLDCVARGTKPVFPALGVVDQLLEVPALRRAKGMRAEHSGVLVARVLHGWSAHGVLEPGDVLLAIDGHRIANNGTVTAFGGFRLGYAAIARLHHVGDTVPVRVLRAGLELELSVTLREEARLVPREQFDTRPRYIVVGGLVFQELTKNFIRTWKPYTLNAPRHLLHAYRSEDRCEARSELVVFSGILATEANHGYADHLHEIVESVNGVPVRDLQHLADMCDGERETGVLAIVTRNATTLLVDVAEARAEAAALLDRYRVPRDRHL